MRGIGYGRGMGFFGMFVYSEGRWAEQATADQYLSVDVHDSDFATIDYHPSGRGRGRFYLGIEPRHYFGDPTASKPVDAAAEISGFVDWARSVVGAKISASDLAELIADPDGSDPENPFVEDTVAQLIALLGLPLPAHLQPNA